MNNTLTKHEQKHNEIVARDLGIVTKQDCANNSGRIYKLSGCLFISCETSRTIPNQFVGSSRGSINEFSPTAGRRMRSYLRECVPEYICMVTLTYPFAYPTNGPETKEHLRRFIQELKRNAPTHTSQQFSCFWFMEFQSRGAPHYHLFVTYSPDKQWVSKRWYEIVNSEDERHLRAGTNCELFKRGREGTISYASKYAAKQEQKQVPEGFENVGRFWGVSGDRRRVSASTFVSRSQRSNPRVLAIVNQMKSLVLSSLEEGFAVKVVMKEGSVVVWFKERRLANKMHVLIARLGSQTMTWDRVFDDAEVDVWQ